MFKYKKYLFARLLVKLHIKINNINIHKNIILDSFIFLVFFFCKYSKIVKQLQKLLT